MAVNCDPSTLANNARCFSCDIPPGGQLAVQTYLLAQLALSNGVITSDDPSELANAARCFSSCYPVGMQLAIQNYLLCQLSGLACDPATLPNLARCFSSCIPIGEQEAVSTYLLAQLTGVTDPAQLLNLARCFLSCIPVGDQTAVQNYLLFKIVTACVPNVAPDSLQVSSSPNNPGATAITVNWNQGLTPGVPLTGFVVKWGTSSGNYNVGSATVGTAVLAYTITGLSPSTQYFIVVYALSGCCLSPASNEISPSTTANGGGTCAFATAWAARVVANGGAAPSVATQNAICDFQNGLIADGLDTLMLSWNALVPDNLIAALTPQLKGGTADPWTNNNFVGGDLTVNGLAGNGTTKFVDLGATGSALWPSSADGGMTVYLFTNPADGVPIGSTDNAACNLQEAIQTFGGTTFLDLFGCNSGRISGGDGRFAGYISGNRTAANSEKLYEANSVTPHFTLASGVAAGNNPSTFNVFAWALNSSGAAAFLCTHRISFIAVHRGLTTAQSALFFARIQTLRQALGGGFV